MIDPARTVQMFEEMDRQLAERWARIKELEGKLGDALGQLEAAEQHVKILREQNERYGSRLAALQSELEAEEANTLAAMQMTQEAESRLSSALDCVRDWKVAHERPMRELEAILSGVVEKPATNCGARHVDGMTRLHECTLPSGHDGWHGQGLFAWPPQSPFP